VARERPDSCATKKKWHITNATELTNSGDASRGVLLQIPTDQVQAIVESVIANEFHRGTRVGALA